MKKIAVLAVLLLSLASHANAVCFIDFLTESVADFEVGVAANFQLDVCCGTPGYTFTVHSGSLPPGLSMNSSGLIAGTPTSATNTTFCVTVTDSVGCHTTRCYSVSAY